MLLSRSIPNSSLFEEFDSLFRNIFQDETSLTTVTSEALYATDDGWTFRAELAGFSKEELTVKVDQGVLTIEAAAKNKERRYSKNLKLNSKIDTANITASLKNGFLEVTLPKQKEELDQPLNIEIR